MTCDLYRLVYVSQATHELSGSELIELLVQSQQRNQEDSITGVLAFDDLHFLQVLEGSQVLVEELFARICGDQRNHSQTVIYRSVVPERVFSDWSMGWIPRRELSYAGFDLGVLHRSDASPGQLNELLGAFAMIGWSKV